MQTIGLLGGMSWESTATYYSLINEGIKNRLGGLHSARLCLFSIDFAPLEDLQHANNWEGAGQELAQAARQVQQGGADFLLICTNTMHRVADAVEEAIDIPLLHIADATGEQLRANQVSKVGLLGTRFTMEQDFYKARIEEKFGIATLIPGDAARSAIHRIIYEELCQGIINAKSRELFLREIEVLTDQGADGVILGCTEIAMLVKQEMTDTPLYDTTAIHCQAAIERCLA